MKANHLLYLKAMDRILSSFRFGEDDAGEIVKKIAFYGVKYINTKPRAEIITIEGVKADLSLEWLIIQSMAQLTPKEFMQLFPIKKFYKGRKYSIKDYYTTREMLNKNDMDKPIGEAIIEFLWDYVNDDIESFLVNHMETCQEFCVSNL
ncbi:hypothetical protein [Caldicellulosiruptor acetigenus]|uniref:hypothetical protein n=1 Tax=Caldicellulosiruptor acetigenus TaxID=301953 RepID=UPI0003FC40A0|nr:hypothetical protein [Caldicellulosiruptor acetigenus]WAM35600.1 hypothetical protein OTK01_001950 [Caldicellulosiruptor acetigenus]